MNRKFVIISCVIFAAITMAASIAAKMKENNNWICTTNATTSALDKDKKSEAKMIKKGKSASHAFSYASAHCRDCTKITCEVKL